MRFQYTSLALLALYKLAKAQEAESSTLAEIDPAWISEYDLSGVPDVAPRPMGSGTCPNSQCGPKDCENCWETCGNCALPDDIYGCQAGQWALTFDDGPSQYTSQLLDILAAANVKATFQMIGSNVIQFPDVVKRAYDEGHQIASHTWSHPHLMSLSNDQIVAEVKATENALLNITGAKPAYIRPPYGEADDRVKAIFKAMGYHTLLWNMDTLDWDISEKKENASLILDSFKSALTKGTDLNAHNDPGFISLQHDIYIDTVQQTPNIEQLLAQYNFHLVLAYECANLPPYQNLSQNTTTVPSSTPTSSRNSTTNISEPNDDADSNSGGNDDSDSASAPDEDDSNTSAPGDVPDDDSNTRVVSKNTVSLSKRGEINSSGRTSNMSTYNVSLHSFLFILFSSHFLLA
ncbi:chitin deacetylase [Basidiobolus ranarum]|uniref:Chitin deacetylase n=1 Tax=Basidiobolus ranarum TaxID=34480 RepID=A0ABR2VRS2_9FUNG